MRERHAKIDADDFWYFIAKHQTEMAKKLEDSYNVNKTEASIQTMIKPYRQWHGAQRRKKNINGNDGSGNDASANDNNYNNTNNKGSGKGFTVVQNNNNNKGKGKGKGPNPTSNGESKGKGKATSFLDGVAFEDACIPMIEAFSNGKGKHSTQIHTDNASMDMDNNVCLGDVATTIARGMKN